MKIETRTKTLVDWEEKLNSENHIKGSARAFGKRNGLIFKSSATWPTGKLFVLEDRIEMQLFSTVVKIKKSSITKIKLHYLPRPWIRIFHQDPDVPTGIQFGTFRWIKLRRMLARNGYKVNETCGL